LPRRNQCSCLKSNKLSKVLEQKKRLINSMSYVYSCYLRCGFSV
jgi:hypothetical protein